MIALRYGAIPLVYKTGGLADTIHLYDPIHKTGNGFVFTAYTNEAFIKAVEEALKVYHQKAQMEDLRQHALRYRFSWEKSAKEYMKVYQKIYRLKKKDKIDEELNSELEDLKIIRDDLREKRNNAKKPISEEKKKVYLDKKKEYNREYMKKKRDKEKSSAIEVAILDFDFDNLLI